MTKVEIIKQWDEYRALIQTLTKRDNTSNNAGYDANNDTKIGNSFFKNFTTITTGASRRFPFFGYCYSIFINFNHTVLIQKINNGIKFRWWVVGINSIITNAVGVCKKIKDSIILISMDIRSSVNNSLNKHRHHND